MNLYKVSIKQIFFLSALLLILTMQNSLGQIPQTISYQGVLTDANGKAVPDGNYSLTFKLYNVDSGGVELWTETYPAVAVVKGIFNVILGSVNPLTLPFNQQYWLGIAVDGAPELTPRIQLTSSAYSLNTQSVADGAVTNSKIADNAITSNKIASGQVVKGINSLKDDVTLAAGTNITITPSGNTLTISATGSAGDAWNLTGNAGTNPVTNFLGTTDNQPLEFRVSGLRTLRLEPNAISPNLIGGFKNNWLTSGVYGATISGGGQSGAANRVTDYYGTVGGGETNQAGDDAGSINDAIWATVGGGSKNTASGGAATVSGGERNTASGGSAIVGGGFDNKAIGNYTTISGGYENEASGLRATIGGGYQNTASGEQATVSGGYKNIASNFFATVGGGAQNEASGNQATIPGGRDNVASGIYSFAAGHRAKAIHDGAFVWGDSTDVDIASSGGNQFIVRATGGTWIYSDATLNSGLRIPAGSSALDTVSNTPFELRVNGLRALRLEPTDVYKSPPNLIGGFKDNWVTSGVYAATISGGGRDGYVNRVTDVYGTVGGGDNNQAGNNDGTTWDAMYATVCGGGSNTASGARATVSGGEGNTASARDDTVGGGYSNTASGGSATVGGGYTNTANGEYATVGGGIYNNASADYATIAGGGCSWLYDPETANRVTAAYGTVGGGGGNTASGTSATIPGGRDNTASGRYSFAAGYRAKAMHDGTFVWGDSTDRDFMSSGNNQFLVRASGGTWIFSSITGTGVYLPANESAWLSLSDRSIKRNIRPVDGKDILSRLAQIPISRWSYKAQDPSIEHIGPMAQDFYAAFGLGEDDKHISTIDPDGVALAAIQGLYELVQEKDAQIDAQQQQIAALEQEKDAQIAALETRLAALEALVLSRNQKQQEDRNVDKPVDGKD